MIGELPVRGADDFGSGHWGASRDGGEREHLGVDLLCYPGTAIFSPVEGLVSKLGYPYRGDTKIRYVQVTDALGAQHRVMYIDPTVDVGAIVTPGDCIGISQDVVQRYNAERLMHHHVSRRSCRTSASSTTS